MCQTIAAFVKENREKQDAYVARRNNLDAVFCNTVANPEGDEEDSSTSSASSCESEMDRIFAFLIRSASSSERKRWRCH